MRLYLPSIFSILFASTAVMAFEKDLDNLTQTPSSISLFTLFESKNTHFDTDVLGKFKATELLPLSLTSKTLIPYTEKEFTRRAAIKAPLDLNLEAGQAAKHSYFLRRIFFKSLMQYSYPAKIGPADVTIQFDNIDTYEDSINSLKRQAMYCHAVGFDAGYFIDARAHSSFERNKYENRLKEVLKKNYFPDAQDWNPQSRNVLEILWAINCCGDGYQYNVSLEIQKAPKKKEEDLTAIFHLSKILYSQNSLDPDELITFYGRSLTRSYQGSLGTLATLHEKEERLDRAGLFLSISANNGSEEDQLRLGLLYRNAHRNERTDIQRQKKMFDLSLKYLKPLALKGSKLGLSAYGLLNYNAWKYDASEDMHLKAHLYVEAEKYFKLAAKQKEKSAQQNLNRLYSQSRVKNKTIEKISGLDAQQEPIFLHGDEMRLPLDVQTEQDICEKCQPKYLRLLKIAATLKDRESLFELGEHDFKEKKFTEAKKSFLEAANAGHGPSQLYLARLYHQAWKNNDNATYHYKVKWYYKAWMNYTRASENGLDLALAYRKMLVWPEVIKPTLY